MAPSRVVIHTHPLSLFLSFSLTLLRAHTHNHTITLTNKQLSLNLSLTHADLSLSLSPHTLSISVCHNLTLLVHARTPILSPTHALYKRANKKTFVPHPRQPDVVNSHSLSLKALIQYLERETGLVRPTITVKKCEPKAHMSQNYLSKKSPVKIAANNQIAQFLSQTIIIRIQFSLWSQALSCLQGKRGMILTHEKKFLYKEKTWLEAAETKQIDICHFFLFAKPVKKVFCSG